MILSIVILTILQIADSVLTYLLLKSGGSELNPVMRWLMGGIGIVPALILVKSLMLVYLIWASVLWLNIAACIVYTLVVLWNFKEYKKNG